jgi:hypothetical protein
MLTRTELESYKATLGQWQSPEDFIRIVGELMDEVGSLQFFTDAQIGFGRDAWVAAKLASTFGPDSVRLGPDRWPDCEMRIEGDVRQFEMTEADIPDRRRGDEYKAAAANPLDGPKLDPVEDWIARAEQAPNALQFAAKEKARKGYPASARLVIYLNISEYGLMQKEIEAAMASSTAPAKDAFCQVWVLWKNRLYLIWENAQQNTLVMLVAEGDGFSGHT